MREIRKVLFLSVMSMKLTLGSVISTRNKQKLW